MQRSTGSQKTTQKRGGTDENTVHGACASVVLPPQPMACMLVMEASFTQKRYRDSFLATAQLGLCYTLLRERTTEHQSLSDSSSFDPRRSAISGACAVSYRQQRIAERRAPAGTRPITMAAVVGQSAVLRLASCRIASNTSLNPFEISCSPSVQVQGGRQGEVIRVGFSPESLVSSGTWPGTVFLKVTGIGRTRPRPVEKRAMRQ